MAGPSRFLPSIRWWEETLSSLLAATPSAGARVRVIRAEAVRAIVEVEHQTALHSRKVWNAVVASPNGERWEISTKRTWGTLVGAKSWLREGHRSPHRPRRR
ncbi:MAG: hypothetical protein WB778_09100 [Thermoplasmata archaeon]